MKQSINILQVPNQEVSFNVTMSNGQISSCDLKLRTLLNGSICCDISFDDVLNQSSVIVTNLMPLAIPYSLKGNIYFEDTGGNENPNYELFNERFRLIYNEDYENEVGY